MHLYEVIRWGNDSDDPFTGGPNGPDTCFLVRATSVQEAARLADRELAAAPHASLDSWAQVAHLLGTELSRETGARILRGPYIAHGHRHGWQSWHRKAADGPWVEQSQD